MRKYARKNLVSIEIRFRYRLFALQFVIGLDIVGAVFEIVV